MCRHHGLLNDHRAQELPGAFSYGTGRSAGLAIGRSPYVDPWRSKEAQRTRSTGGDATDNLGCPPPFGGPAAPGRRSLKVAAPGAVGRSFATLDYWVVRGAAAGGPS